MSKSKELKVYSSGKTSSSQEQLQEECPLLCPQCNIVLREVAGEWRCTSCDSIIPEIDGVPIFTDASYYHAEIPEEKMLRLLRRADEVGVHQAVYQFDPLGENGNLSQYIFDPNRADWRFIIPNMHSSNILDLGAGYGTNSFSLAHCSRHVVAVENVLASARFIEARRKQENITNMKVIHAEIDELPFPDEQFDLVVANGLFERLLIKEERILSTDRKQECLHYVTKFLRPGGYLLLGVKNRLGLNFVLEKKEFSKKLRTYKAYNSYWGYNKLLYKAGLHCHSFYWVEPGYSEPRCWIPLGNRGSAMHYLASPRHAESWKATLLRHFLRFLASIGGARFFASDFLIISKRKPEL